MDTVNKIRIFAIPFDTKEDERGLYFYMNKLPPIKVLIAEADTRGHTRVFIYTDLVSSKKLLNTIVIDLFGRYTKK